MIRPAPLCISIRVPRVGQFSGSLTGNPCRAPKLLVQCRLTAPRVLSDQYGGDQNTRPRLVNEVLKNSRKGVEGGLEMIQFQDRHRSLNCEGASMTLPA